MASLFSHQKSPSPISGVRVGGGRGGGPATAATPGGPCLGIRGLEFFKGLAPDAPQEVPPEQETTEEVVAVSLPKASCEAETSL